MNFRWIYFGEKGGDALMHVYVWEHIASLYSCGEMKPLRVMSIHKSVCVTSFDDVLTKARGNILFYADSTLISKIYVIWSPLSSFYGSLYQIVFHFFFFCVFKFPLKVISDYMYFLNFKEILYW